MIKLLRYSNTNTYLIKGSKGYLLFDTGWAGSFPLFCDEIKKEGISSSEIKYIIISHFHPDHMGIAQEIAKKAGCRIAVCDLQREYIHSSDHIFEKEKNKNFIPIDEAFVDFYSIGQSRELLAKIGICGEVFHTPGHSEDSISLWLDEGRLFVGDLNPLYELELHRNTLIGKSWERLLLLNPKEVYYGHAKPLIIDRICEEKDSKNPEDNGEKSSKDTFLLVKSIMKLVDRGVHIDRICAKTGADKVFVEDVTRMYLTHRDVGVQGILDRIEIKNR